MYTYKDFMTDKIHKTRGTFVRWQKDGPLNVWGVLFQKPRSVMWVPRYLLTQETLAQLPKAPDVGGHS